MKNIDVTNGNLYLDGISYTVTKQLTREEFEQLDCMVKGRKFDFKPYFNIIKQSLAEPCQIGGKMFYPTFYFKGSKLSAIYLHLKEQRRDYPKNFDFEGYEAIFKQWLFEQLGNPSHIDRFARTSYQYEWGKVMYDVDQKGGTNHIAIEYEIDSSAYH